MLAIKTPSSQKFKTVLSNFDCNCGKSYSLLSSLINHINSLNENGVHFKKDRGVPEGRTLKMKK